MSLIDLATLPAAPAALCRWLSLISNGISIDVRARFTVAISVTHATKGMIISSCPGGQRLGRMRGWHVLRHSFASRCSVAGIDQRIGNDWMGRHTQDR